MRILSLVGFATLAIACATPSVEHEQSAASALEKDDASDVTGEDSCSNMDGDDGSSTADGDSGSGGEVDYGASALDGDSGSGGPTDYGASSVDGDSGSGGNLNLAGITPKPKPKPVCPPPTKACKLYDEKDDESACHWTGNYTGVTAGDPVTCFVTGKVYYYECKSTPNGGTKWEPRSPKPSTDCKEFHVGPKPATVGGTGVQHPCK